MKTALAAILAAFLISSCAPSTPQARIEARPETFSSLSRTHQNLVQQGQIAKGMTPEAVTLAWGNPSQIFEGSKGNIASRRWDYSGSRPVYSSGLHDGIGHGYGYHGGGRFSTLGLDYGPDVVYIPHRLATVWFLNGQVESWEKAL